MSEPSWQVAALYRFAPFGAQAAAFRGPLQALCDARGVIGTLLLAPEGINGTIAGQGDALEAVLDHIRALPGCATLSLKRAREIREALIAQGLNPTISRAVGRGEREPLVPTPDNTPEPRNRRVEIIVR